MKTHKNSFGHRLRQFRLSLGMNQQTFANELKLALATVNRWERNIGEPSPLAWQAIEGLAREHHVKIPSRLVPSRLAS